MPRGIGGWVDPAFRSVADLFAVSVAQGYERGALALRLDGHTVLDIWGGAADTSAGAVWRENTLACCFSVTKGVFALLIHRLVERSLVDLDAPIATGWPSFAAAGKETITVLDVLTHRAGLPATDTPAPNGMLYDQKAMASALAASAPVVAVKAAPAYQNMTFGTLLTEIAERAAGQDIRSLLAQEITGPLAADFAIGLTPEDCARCATLTQDDPTSLFRALEEDPQSLFARSMAFFDTNETFNSDRWRTTVIGSGSGHATALGVARIYEAFLSGPILSPARRLALGVELTKTEADPVLGLPLRLGEGVELSNPPLLDFGPSSRAMGYWGAGGAQGFADPDAGLAFGYVTGHMDPTLGSSPRARALIKEVYACL